MEEKKAAVIDVARGNAPAEILDLYIQAEKGCLALPLLKERKVGRNLNQAGSFT